MRAILVMVLVGFLGVASLGVGLAGVLDTEVSCGERVMAPGDTCTGTEKYRTVVRDYAEQKAREDAESFVGIGFGTFFLLILAVMLAGVRRYWRLRRQGALGQLDQRARYSARSRPFPG